MKLKSLSILVGLMLLASLCAFGQAVSGTILGTVTDSSGAVVPNAKVTVTETNTGISRTNTSNDSGNYTFPDLPPGTYSVSAEMTGFKKFTQTGVLLQVNTSPRVDLALQPGNVSETVEVTAQAAVLQTESASTGSQISSVVTENLPLGTGRNFQGLLNLVPGTTRASYQHSQFFNASNSLQTQVNGTMRMGNNYQIEGIDNNERTGLLQIAIPPIEAIQNVDVATSNFDAELGRASGAVTNVILKSGTNDGHGAAYWFHRNSSLNARNYFDKSVGHQAYNYWGGNYGGAFIKNKLFYFGDFLQVKDHQANTNTLTIPTADMRTGNLSRSATTIYDPLTGDATGANRTPFAGNIIPSARINPISTKILALVPATNFGSADTNNWFGLLPFTKDSNSMDWKMDFNPSDKDRLSGRFTFSRPVIYQMPAFGLAGGAAQSAFAGTGVQKTYSTGLNWNHIFSTTLVGELRVGVAHYNNVAQPADYGTKSTEQLGIPGVNLDEYSSGMVGINLNGGFSGPLVGYSASLPWKRAEANIDIANHYTKSLGNHTIKWGWDMRRVRDELLQMQTFSPRGVFNFGDAQTSTVGAKTSYFNNMASFLLDVPSSSGRDLATFFPALRAWQNFFFLQDRWIVNQKLTLNFGLRYELYPPATPRLKGGFSQYDPYANTLSVAGYGNVPMNVGIAYHKNYWAPRLGAAYRLNDKTVIRTGAGVSYTPFPDNSYAYNYPVRANNSFNAAYNYGPALLPNGSVSTFQAGFPAPILVAIPDSGVITNPDKNSSYVVVNPNFKNPSVLSWNFAVQRQLPFHFALDVAYVGNHGIHTPLNYNLNAATVIGKGTAGQPQFPTFGRTAGTNLMFAGYSSMYNGLQIKLDRRYTSGLNITTAYTYGKGMGFQQGDDGGTMFYINFRRNYARNDFDRTHTYVQSFIYDLPFGKGKKWLSNGIAAKTIGGWRVNGILTLMTGTPLNFSAPGAGLNTPGNAQTPDLIGPWTVKKGIALGNPWFDQASFATPVGANFGSLGRNPFSGPGFYNLDFSLFKLFHLTERINAELRAETFSATNTPQFNNPNTTVGNANFGYITGAGGGRQMQLGLKINF